MDIKKTKQSGFTLIELLTVTAIIIIITSIVLANNSRFGGSVQLENLAYDIALSVRQAQVFGISGQHSGTNGINTFNGIFGVHFSLTDRTTYILFSDTLGAPDGQYEPGEEVQTTELHSGYTVSDICVTSGASVDCNIPQLDIVFRRPEPDAHLRTDPAPAGEWDRASVTVESPRGDIRKIDFDQNGQIYVEPGT